MELTVLPLSGSSNVSEDKRQSDREVHDSESRTTRDGDITPPADAVDARYRWNSPPINKYRMAAAFWSFFVALIPHLEIYFNLTYTVVSLIFLSPIVGYMTAAFLNNLVHIRLGQRGVGCLAPLFHLVAFLVISFHPPWPVVVVVYSLVGFGNGLVDAAWSAWIGNMVNSNEATGVLQACYALGATVAPLIATAIVSEAQLGWWSFYYVMIGASTVELFSCAITFWDRTGAVYMAEHPHPQLGTHGKSGRTRQALKSKVTWILSVFILLYNGAEVSIGGWVVVFMTTVRGATSFVGGATATGFWGGMTVGRIALSFLTARLGEFRAMVLYIVLAIALELVFWLVPNIVVSAVATALLGLVTGPMYPAAVVLMTKLLPRSLHVGAIGFVTAIGGTGSALLPFAVGAIAQAKGVQTLQPIIIAICGTLAVLWFILYRVTSRSKESGDPRPHF
ncbi:hypothetical protein NUW58_g1065 [Xylaria curta]|uniref:Uncharacterized protein n=1 Tax=Xylaria curta TaxID=42375 RepID=A0ACC1PLU0_9PEZI|nr:hypothetical protein NUW58_g1065 [Xylaria curta]